MKTNGDVAALISSLLDLVDRPAWQEWSRNSSLGFNPPMPKPSYKVIKHENEKTILVRQVESGAVFRITAEIVQPGTE